MIIEKSQKDVHLRNMIEDYKRHVKNADLAVIGIQDLMFIKHNVKIPVFDIISELAKYDDSILVLKSERG